jgi:hypothetical protein
MKQTTTVYSQPSEKGRPGLLVAVADKTLQELIHVGAIVQERIRSFEPALKAVEDAIAAAAVERLEDDGEVVFDTLNGMRARVRVEYSWEIPPENVSSLQELLGDRHDLVEREVIVRPTPELIAMACDGDRGYEIRRHLSIRRKAPKVTIVAEDHGETGAGT